MMDDEYRRKINWKKVQEGFLMFAQTVSCVFIMVYLVCLTLVIFFFGDLTIFIYTTNITILMVAFAYMFKLENKYLNAIACITFLQFFFVDFGMHLALGIAQLVIILLRVPFSKKAIFTGFFFWLGYMFLFDDVFRIAEIMLIPVPDRILFSISVIYILCISTFLVYIIKQKEGCLKNGD